MSELTWDQLEAVFSVLKHAGWNGNRLTDIDTKIESLESYGWVVFDTAREFASKFCGIKPIEIEGRSTIYLGEINDEEELDIALDWKKATGENIFPIGYHGIVGLFLEETGKIYNNIEDVGIMALLGNDINTGLYNLFFGEEISTVHYEYSG